MKKSKAEVKDDLIRLFIARLNTAVREGYRFDVMMDEGTHLEVHLSHPTNKHTWRTCTLRYENGITKEDLGILVLDAKRKRTEGKLFTAVFANNEKDAFWNVFVPNFSKRSW